MARRCSSRSATSTPCCASRATAPGSAGRSRRRCPRSPTSPSPTTRRCSTTLTRPSCRATTRCSSSTTGRTVPAARARGRSTATPARSNTTSTSNGRRRRWPGSSSFRCATTARTTRAPSPRRTRTCATAGRWSSKATCTTSDTRARVTTARSPMRPCSKLTAMGASCLRSASIGVSGPQRAACTARCRRVSARESRGSPFGR